MKQKNNKLKLVRDIQTLTYNYRDTYYIDIQLNAIEKVIEGWLFDSRIGVKDFIVGVEYNNTTKEFDDFEELIESIIEECIDDYKEHYGAYKGGKSNVIRNRIHQD